MITLEREDFGDDPVSEEIRIISSSEHLLRRIWKDDKGMVLLDLTYEYDCNGSCTYGIALDEKHRIVCFIENIYTSTGMLSESIERLPSGEEYSRTVTKYDPLGRIERVEYYRDGKVSHYAKPAPDLNGFLYFDEKMAEISTPMSDSLIIQYINSNTA